MEFLKDFNIAFAKREVEYIAERVTDEIDWNIIGDRKIQGKKIFTAELEQMKSEKMTELTIDQILSHGKIGAASGTMKMQNGKKYAFSDFYEFNGAKGSKIKSMTSYIIEIE